MRRGGILDVKELKNIFQKRRIFTQPLDGTGNPEYSSSLHEIDDIFFKVDGDNIDIFELRNVAEIPTWVKLTTTSSSSERKTQSYNYEIGDNTTFVLPSDANVVDFIEFNGRIQLKGTDYTLTSTDFTITDTPNDSGIFVLYYFKNVGVIQHAQNTDTGTNSNSFIIGDGLDSNKEILANTSSTSKPKMRYNTSISQWEYSNDGVEYQVFSSASGIDEVLALNQPLTTDREIDMNNNTLTFRDYNKGLSMKNTFQLGSGFDGDVNTIKPLSDGKILVGGSFTEYNGTPCSTIVKLNVDGTIDTSFTAPEIDGSIYDIKLQSDGKIIIAGGITTIDGVSCLSNVARLNVNGSRDDTFSYPDTTSYSMNNRVLYLVVKSDDSLAVIGDNFVSGIINKQGLFGLNVDGTIDTTFNSNIGTGYNGETFYIELVESDKFIVCSNASSYDGVSGDHNLKRFNADGTVDSTFSATNLVSNIPETFAELPDGRYLVGYTNYGNNLVNLRMLNNNGTYDSTWTQEGSGISKSSNGTRCSVGRILRQSDGNFIIFGLFDRFNGNVVSNMVGLNADGTLNTNFNSSGRDTSRLDGSDKPVALLADDGFVFNGLGVNIKYDGYTIPNFIKCDKEGNINITNITSIGVMGYNNFEPTDYELGDYGFVHNKRLKEYVEESSNPIIVNQNISGSVTVDLSLGVHFKFILDANTTLDFTNEVEGKQYTFEFIQLDSAKTLTWATGRYRFSFGNEPTLTDPTTNGSSPIKAVDIVTCLCSTIGRLDIVVTPDMKEN